jgi:hypothetical protein
MLQYRLSARRVIQLNCSATDEVFTQVLFKNLSTPMRWLYKLPTLGMYNCIQLQIVFFTPDGGKILILIPLSE